MKRILQLILCLLVLSVSGFSDLFQKAPQYFESKKLIEWKGDWFGLFSNLTRALEWIYCVKQDPNLSVYLNMNQAYGIYGNLIEHLFEEIKDPQVLTKPPGGWWIDFSTSDYPRSYSALKKFPTDGMVNYQRSKYVYMNVGLFTDPDFALFRERMQPIIAQYLKPKPEILKKIDVVRSAMNRVPGKTKIGIHVRATSHYQGYSKSSEQFIDDVMRDIDEMMSSRDVGETQIFLATLLAPLVDKISEKYDVVVCDIGRVPDASLDWVSCVNTHELDMYRDVVVDAWCLADCDELWGGSSNMTVFAACFNPALKVHLLPSLAAFDGW